MTLQLSCPPVRTLEREDSLEPTHIRTDGSEVSSELSSDDGDEEGHLSRRREDEGGNEDVGVGVHEEEEAAAPGNSIRDEEVGLGIVIPDTDSATGSPGARGVISTGNERPGSPSPSPSPSPSVVERRRQRRTRRREEKMKKSGLRKKLRLLTDLLACLDSLVFMELGTFYYVESSLWLFCLRAVLHYVFLTPKSESFPFLMPAAQSHIVSIFLPNMMCFLLHLFGSVPRASRDVHRGYLHGGVLADFIGQKPPSSRLPLLLLDCIVLLVQCLMLAVHSDREALRGGMRKFVPFENGGDGAGGQGAVGLGLGRLAVADDFAARAGAGRSQTPPTRRAATQDQDAAERGEAGEAGEAAQERHEGGDIEGSSDDDNEPQQVGSSRTDEVETTDGTDGDEGARLQSPEAAADALLHDVLNSGLGVLGEYHIIHTLRTASMDFESAAAHSLRTLGYTATLTALAARRGSVPIESPHPS